VGSADGIGTGPEPPWAGGGRGIPVPAQLPLDAQGFSGRHEELGRLHALLPPSGPDGLDGSVPVVVISHTAFGARSLMSFSRGTLTSEGKVMSNSPVANASIRVERPGNPEDFSARHDSDFQNKHRNKRGTAINLRSDEGRAILYRMIERTDVLVENFRPDVKTRLGFDYETLQSRNPRFILASVSAFGQDGDNFVFESASLASWRLHPRSPPVELLPDRQ